MSQSEEQKALIELSEIKDMTVEDLCSIAVFDDVADGICMNCKNVSDVELDQDNGYCIYCGKSNIKSCLVLAKLI